MKCYLEGPILTGRSTAFQQCNKAFFPNGCHQVESRLLLYALTSTLPFTVSKGPSQNPEKQTIILTLYWLYHAVLEGYFLLA